MRSTWMLVFLALAACGGPETTQYELKKVFEVAGRQGVATDGRERFYVSGSGALFLYDREGRQLAANEAPFEGLERRANHIGDIDFHAGELYAGIEWFEDGRASNIQIAIYDADTLAYKRAFPWEPESGQVEVSGIAVDEVNGAIWMTDWVDGRYVYRYDLGTGGYVGKLHLRPVPQWQQGIAARDGVLYITADDGDAEQDEVDNLWRVEVPKDGTAAYVTHEKAFTEFERTGEIEGVCFHEAAGLLLVHHNRGKRIVLGMPKGLYPGYDREIHEVYVYKVERPR